MEHYGKLCNYYFGGRLEDGDYDVYFLNTKEEDEDSKAPIPYDSSDHFCYIDSCITWAAYWLEFHKPKWYCCKIQDPDLNIVKKYFDYDSLLEDLWRTLIDVNISEDERTEQDWFIFPEGTEKEEIWHWFDDRHSKGVYYLLYEMEETLMNEIYNTYKERCRDCAFLVAGDNDEWICDGLEPCESIDTCPEGMDDLEK